MGFLSNIFGGKTKANASVDYAVSMSCGKYVKRIEDLMRVEKGVVETKIDLDTKTVSLHYDKDITDDKKLQGAIEGLGFTVSTK